MKPSSPRYWPLVIALTCVYAYAFLDRLVLALMVDPIKHDLGLSDVQMGVLLGVAFALFYGVLNLPAGYLVDRVSRRGLIGVASTIWALMTIACGTAGNFIQLFFGRAGVGLAKAVITPAAYSLIHDRVPAARRGLAFSVYAMAPVIGNATALIGGGLLYGAARRGVFQRLPLIGQLHAWQIMLVIIGVAGLPVSLLLLLFREPARPMRTHSSGAGLADVFLHLRSHAARYVPLVAYVTFGSMVTFSQASWLPAILGRTWHLPVHDVGTLLGPVLLVSGVAGLMAGGMMLNRLAAAGRDIRIYGMVAAVGGMVGFAGVPLATSLHGALGFAAIGMFFGGANNPIAATTLAAITPSHLMGKVTAIYLFCQTLFGQALAPVILALTARHVFAGPLAIDPAMVSLMVIYGVAGFGAAWALRRALTGRQV